MEDWFLPKLVLSGQEEVIGAVGEEVFLSPLLLVKKSFPHSQYHVLINLPFTLTFSASQIFSS